VQQIGGCWQLCYSFLSSSTWKQIVACERAMNGRDLAKNHIPNLSWFDSFLKDLSSLRTQTCILALAHTNMHTSTFYTMAEAARMIKLTSSEGLVVIEISVAAAMNSELLKYALDLDNDQSNLVRL
jgi:hypothetical protein